MIYKILIYEKINNYKNKNTISENKTIKYL